MPTYQIVSGFVIDGATLALAAGNIIKIDLTNANTWTGIQTFGNYISIGGAQLNCSSLTDGDVLQYNHLGNWINVPLSSLGVASLNGLTGGLSVTTPNSTLSVGTDAFTNVTIDINLGNANSWSATQTFTSAIELSITAASLVGATAGTVDWTQPVQGTTFKVFSAYADGYENSGAMPPPQKITFPVAFTETPLIVGNDTGMILTVGTTQVEFPMGMAAPASGNIIIIGV